MRYLLFFWVSTSFILGCNSSDIETNNFETSKEYISDTIVSQQEISRLDSAVENNGDLYKGNIEIISTKVTYNSSFIPTLHLNLKNNLEKTIVAFEYAVFSQKCKVKVVKKEVKFYSKTSISLQQPFPSLQKCSIELGQIRIGAIILSDGRKLDDPGFNYLVQINSK